MVRTLGRGAFGEVWLAERHSSLLTIQVALKLPFESTANIPAIRQEAQLWLKASGHANIVPVLDAEVYNGQVVIASEYMAGGSLADWIVIHGGKAPSVEAAIIMMRGILAGLAHLHANQLIHRDLKPENVLLQATTPRLTDFGLTRVLNATGHNSDPSGTPAYMAPEAFQGRYSQVSDVWAAGILLHEMLVGALPYPHTDFYSLLMQIASEAPLTFSEEIPNGIRPILSRALEKRPSDRFTTVEEMAEALAGTVTPYRSPVATRLRTGKNNLPIQATSFVGRDKEMAELKSLLSKTRLLALTGSGGCGKTRIALRLATEVLDEYPDGVWLAELAPLTDATLITKSIADVMKLREVRGEPIATTLIAALKERHLLLVLDNCEHLLNAAADLVDAVLRSCPDIRVLISSREAIGIAG
jgi:serine/threonine protein kinase